MLAVNTLIDNVFDGRYGSGSKGGIYGRSTLACDVVGASISHVCSSSCVGATIRLLPHIVDAMTAHRPCTNTNTYLAPFTSQFLNMVSSILFLTGDMKKLNNSIYVGDQSSEWSMFSRSSEPCSGYYELCWCEADTHLDEGVQKLVVGGSLVCRVLLSETTWIARCSNLVSRFTEVKLIASAYGGGSYLSMLGYKGVGAIGVASYTDTSKVCLQGILYPFITEVQCMYDRLAGVLDNTPIARNERYEQYLTDCAINMKLTPTVEEYRCNTLQSRIADLDYIPISPSSQGGYDPISPSSQGGYDPVSPSPQGDYAPGSPSYQGGYAPGSPSYQGGYAPGSPSYQGGYAPISPSHQGKAMDIHSSHYTGGIDWLTANITQPTSS